MLQINCNPFPELTTDRLLLRRIKISDAEAVFFLRSDESVMKYIDKEREKSVEETENHIKRLDTMIDENNGLVWGITLKENAVNLIGSICLWNFQREHFRAEIGYVLHPDYWKKGFMKEALNRVIDFGFSTLKLHSIEAIINPENSASAAVLQSIGFEQEAYFKENYFFQGEFLNTAIYSLLHQTASYRT